MLILVAGAGARSAVGAGGMCIWRISVTDPWRGDEAKGIDYADRLNVVFEHGVEYMGMRGLVSL
jgi:hypothetical protein